VTGLLLGAALDGLGAHPAAWRRTAVPPRTLFDPRRVAAMAQLAERGALDFVTLDDQFSAPAPGFLHGALDAWLALTHAAAVTTRVTLFPTGFAQGDPAVMAARAVTLDRVAAGRGGWRPRVALTEAERRRATADPPAHAAFTEERFARTDAFVAAVTGLWDSWPEGSPAGMHRAGADGEDPGEPGHPRLPTAPWGRPLTAVLAHFHTPYRLAARHADLVFVTPRDREDVLAVRAELAALCGELRRNAAPPAVLADLNVVLAETASAAAGRLSELDADLPFTSDAATFTGTAAELAALMAEWHRDGGVDGFRIRPAVLAEDLTATVETLVPELRERGLLPDDLPPPLRSRLQSAAV
jgi:alkanesulfonate monooxygenase SsuD/methylene tetrahydromethanopterin reductase-like flavin-dependent oxidoreductase (luciferase family)